MTTLVIGAAASGKSRYAEDLLLRAGNGPRIYLATMRPWGEEARRRILRHRAMRAEKGFSTVERYTALKGLELPPGAEVLLECLGNLCANELFDPEGAGERAEEAVLEGVLDLQRRCRQLVLISNEVFSGGRAYQGQTLRYLEALGRINCALAAAADNVCEVVCGLPVYHKGKEPV